MYNIKDEVIIQFGLAQTIQSIFKLLRPKQWIKNSFLFVAIIFSLNIGNALLFLKVIEAFLSFSLLSSSVYILNDILDAENDKWHPEKRMRPIASGRISKSFAIVFLIIITIISFICAYTLGKSFLLISLVYFVMNYTYTLLLKKIVILDVMIIAIGFVLRAIAGAVVIDVEVSSWLLLCTFLLALFLGLNKRRHEIILLENNASSHRKILGEYNIELLNHMISVSSSAALISYCLYTFNSAHSKNLIFTIPFIVYGLFRYQYLSFNKNMGGSAEIVLTSDLPMIINVILWVITCITVLYIS